MSIKIKKVLIANRGEIALRIIRSLKELGFKTVAIFSEVDRNALHVRNSDEAYLVGPAPSAQSYLQADKIIAIAKNCRADAIHPGYGFLSENAEFAKKVAEAGIAFIGPSPQAIRVMGSKLEAKEAAMAYQIPMVPGGNHAISDIGEAKQIAATVGYPILIKASAGGGGKGMRIVEDAHNFEEQMQRAISEATSAFGNGSVFIEKYISSPRHIEIQILGDMHGNIVHLFERECSVQRRYQKVIEEAPSSALSENLRTAMGNAAVMVAKSVNYYGAGTVEFIVDEQLNFYFLEMNTRLQVEHPVTEMITGIDLVKEQVRIAEGHPLSFQQNDLKIHGHAIELRVYAEDPLNNFLPDIGKLVKYKTPQGPGIRVDDGFEQNMEIPIYYDPMIAKLVAYGSNRTEAIQRMIRAIDEYEITGIENTLSFGKFVMQHEAFTSGKFDTHFVSKYFNSESLKNVVDKDTEEIAAGLSIFLYNKSKNNNHIQIADHKQSSKWKSNRLR